jgi:Translation initiation factor IF-2, N-terminal region
MATTKKTTKKKTTKKKVAKKGAVKKAGSLRVYEVADSLGTDATSVVELAQDLGIPVTNHLAFVTEAQAQQLRNAFARRGQPAEKPTRTRKKAASSKKKAASSKKKGGKRKARKAQAGATSITIQQGAGNPRLKNQCLTIIAGCGC